MTQAAPPKITFPCDDYPVKIMGDASQDFFDFVIETTEQFAPKFKREKIATKSSSKGRYTAITVYITATGVEQLEQYHQALRQNPATKIVL
jgi:hypothetical protein